MKIKNIIFDWLGTLSDDLTPVHKASMIVFKKLIKETNNYGVKLLFKGINGSIHDKTKIML